MERPMNIEALTSHHIAAKTPLRRLGSSVAWFEEQADRASGPDRKLFKSKAKAMREVVTSVFVARFTAGEYADA